MSRSRIGLLLGMIIIIIAIAVYIARPKDTLIKGTSSRVWTTEGVVLSGSKSIAEYRTAVTTQELQDQDALSLIIDLNGLCLLPSHASEIGFRAGADSYYLSLKDYVQDCSQEPQTAVIPFSDIFRGPVPANADSLYIQIWYPTHFSVDISRLETYNRVLGTTTTKSKRPIKSPRPGASPKISSIPAATLSATPSPSLTPSTLPSPSPTPTGTTWTIKSVSSMKGTKDKLCGQDSPEFVNRWVTTAKNLGVTHIAVETPYDSPACGDAVAYTDLWVRTIRSAGLGVWHRHMPLAYEGIYNTPKNRDNNYTTQIAEYIRSHPAFFRAGDILTPIPEPQNGGIQGVTYCSYNVCIFDSAAHFNSWLRDTHTAVVNTLNEIGLNNQIKVGYWGFDGFVAWGDNNPDWQGILEDATIAQMGNITIDHYPEIVGDTMENDLNELQARYPSVPIVIGEWGTITGGEIENLVNLSMRAAKRPGVSGFNYWHMGMGGNEKLILDDFSPNLQYDEVQNYFR